MKDSPYTKHIIMLVVLLLGFYLIRMFGLSFPVSVTTSAVSSELSVVGEGKVDVVPDTAYVDVGVSVQNVSSAEEAQKQITEKNNAIIKAVKELGIREEDIKTSNFSVFPNYSYETGRNVQTGYNGNVTLSIKSSNITVTAKVIENATKAGANQIQGTRFVVDSPEKYREEARDKAIANAKDQAQKLAKSLGIQLGKVTNIVESSPSSVPPLYFADKALSSGMGGGPGNPDIQPGSQTITSTVTLYFDKR